MSTNAPGSSEDTSDPSVRLLAMDELAQRQQGVDSSEDRVSQNLNQPPVYQHPFFADGKEAYPLNTEVAQNLGATGPSHRIVYTINESEWYETLRELQANMADLKDARWRASNYSKLSRFPGLRLRNTDTSAHEVRVLEELVLAGMHRLSRIHPDPLVQTEWASRAETFSGSLRTINHDANPEGGIALGDAEAATSANLESARYQRYQRRAARLFVASERDSILMGVTKGFALVLCTPVILSAAAVFSAGTVLYGAGKIIIGVGHIVTCGKLR